MNLDEFMDELRGIADSAREEIARGEHVREHLRQSEWLGEELREMNLAAPAPGMQIRWALWAWDEGCLGFTARSAGDQFINAGTGVAESGLTRAGAAAILESLVATQLRLMDLMRELPAGDGEE